MADFYDILGVSKNASQDEIKKAFRKAAAKNHPDRGGDEETFKKINEANDVLSDPDKRARYDKFGDNWDKMGNGPDIDMGDIFSHFGGFGSMFGFGGSQDRGPEQGTTIQARIAVDINDIFNGSSRELEVDVEVRCKECQGKGGETVTCPHCNGTGMITETRQFGPGQIFQSSHPCEHCHGSGKIHKTRCKHCGGSGIEHTKRNIKVNIRPGIQNGETITFSGMGYESHDPRGRNGDLIVQCIYNINDKKYAIQGNDVYEKINIPYYDCIIGCEREVTLPNGKKHTINIKKYSQDGDSVKLYGQGLNGGNYIFIIGVTLPTVINDNEKELLQKIQKLH